MLNNFYYLLKPIIPRPLQLGLRRMIVASNLEKYRDIWPIDPKSAKKPEWFKGWPGGKQFALVITHDVEQARGLKKLGQLLDIDRKNEIKSAVGIVPERYIIPADTVENIRKTGHDVYVHDLNHDGKLFSNYRTFHARAPRINQYLRKWNTRGFRAGAMHHNLDWIGELDIEYDMSTFDTDPFEPMPDGVGTIFPFIVSCAQRGRSYVEIPYTLPQDLMTLVIHPKKTIDIWVDKLDWIVKNGGMACVNTHPDYKTFGDDSPSYRQYSVSKYTQFIAHVCEQYRSLMWNPSPMELAQFVREANTGNSP